VRASDKGFTALSQSSDTFPAISCSNDVMKNSSFVFVMLIALAVLNPCDAGIPGWLTAEKRDWKFIQSVGGMKVSLEKRQLLVSCDVSGLKTVTIKPTMVNSGIGVREIKCSRADGNIQITVVTSVIEKGMKSACGSVDLSAYPAGPYNVVYLDPDGTTHALGKIELP
jgi:hypothetical protein